MASKPLQFLMVIALALSGVVAPLVRASVSCCGGYDDVAVKAVAVEVENSSLEHRACCGGCDSKVAVSAEITERSPSDHSNHRPSHGPCDGDCHCSLCGAIAAMSGAVLPPDLAGVFFAVELARVQIERLVCPKDQRFDLLRPPQC